MAYEQVSEAHQWAQAAGADLTGKLHLLCKLDTSGNVVVAAAATDAIIGVIREEAALGKPATVQFSGIAKVICGGTVNVGDRLTSDGNGKAIATTSTGNRTIGQALMAGDPNDIISAICVLGTL